MDVEISKVILGANRGGPRPSKGRGLGLCVASPSPTGNLRLQESFANCQPCCTLWCRVRSYRLQHRWLATLRARRTPFTRPGLLGP